MVWELEGGQAPGRWHSSFQKADGLVRDSIRHWGVDMMKGLGRMHYGPIARMFTRSQCLTSQWVSGRCTPWWLEDMSGVSMASSISASGSAKWLHLLGDSRQSWLPQGEGGFTQSSRALWLLQSSSKCASIYLQKPSGPLRNPPSWCGVGASEPEPLGLGEGLISPVHGNGVLWECG